MSYEKLIQYNFQGMLDNAEEAGACKPTIASLRKYENMKDFFRQ